MRGAPIVISPSCILPSLHHPFQHPRNLGPHKPFLTLLSALDPIQHQSFWTGVQSVQFAFRPSRRKPAEPVVFVLELLCEGADWRIGHRKLLDPPFPTLNPWATQK